MKLSKSQIHQAARSVINELKEQGQITFKVSEEQVLQRATAIVEADFQREAALDQEVHAMMDDLERNNSGEFQRYKMFPLLKKRLAKEKGIVL